MNTQTLMHLLQEQGKKVRTTTTTAYPPIKGGCAVIILNPSVGTSLVVDPYSLAIINGGWSPFELGENISLTYKYSAHKEEHYCSVSGGPETIGTPVECLRFTGLEVEINFWKKNTNPLKNRIYFEEYVPLFEYYQNEEQALVSRVEITRLQFETLRQSPGIIHIADQPGLGRYLTDEKTNTSYFEEKEPGFAIPQALVYTAETVVLPVYFEESNTCWVNEERTTYKPSRFFRQNMLVYAPSFKPIRDINQHLGGAEYLARYYYKHNI